MTLARSNSVQRIDRLVLRQFRCYESLELELASDVNVLVGQNGAGKTTVLEAIAISLSELLAPFPGTKPRSIDEDDVRCKTYEHNGLLDRQRMYPTSVGATGQFFGERISWEKSLTAPGGRTTQGTGLRHQSSLAFERVKLGEPLDLPLVTYYGTQRVWLLKKKKTEAKRGVGSRWDGYTDCLDPASNHRSLSEWMYQQTLVELQNGTRLPHLEGIERAVCRSVPGATSFRYNVKLQELELRVGEDLLPFSFLSDGYRGILGLVADLAWRAGVLNPHLGNEAPEKSSGVVLIDEIDLHLHPRWQRRVLQDLRDTFPSVQFIVTTHSPQVIASARRGEVTLLETRGPSGQPYVEGRDSNSLLQAVFGVGQRPDDAERELDRLAELIDDDRLVEARQLLEHLEQQMSIDDPSLVRSRWELEMASTPEQKEQ